MKANKKLLASAMALGLAGLTTVGSTYAWFSMNRTVEASGMKVNATTSTNLLISKIQTTDTNKRLEGGAESVDLTADATTLSPTSTVDGTNWFSATGDKTNSSSALAGSYTTVAAGELKNYALINTVYVQNYDSTKTNTASGSKLVLESVSVNFASGDLLSPSFRVLVICGDTKLFVAPTITTTEKTTAAVKSVEGGNATKEDVTIAETTYSTGVATLGANNTLIANMNYNDVTEIKICVYFDGEDAACKADNIPTNIGDYTVGVKFTTQNA